MNPDISIHALREESDTGCRPESRPLPDFNPRPPRGERHYLIIGFAPVSQFQSTPSARRATRAADGAVRPIQISIHALREESDASCSASWGSSSHFNPRPPRGERQYLPIEEINSTQFQSTPSARRATYMPEIAKSKGKISIHALREESDLPRRSSKITWQNFNPRPPRGERRGRWYSALHPSRISIHALREESDR